MRSIYGISGKAGSGKNTVADILHETLEKLGTDYEIKPMKQAVCDELQQAIQPEINLDFILSDAFKPVFFEMTEERFKFPDDVECTIDRSKPMSGRRMMQWWATEVRRNEDPHYWVKAWEKGGMWSFLTQYRWSVGHKIIPDIRFENECDMVQRYNGILIRVERDDLELGDTHEHPSETELDGYEFDYVIVNNGTLDDLQDAVKGILVEDYMERLGYTKTRTERRKVFGQV